MDNNRCALMRKIETVSFAMDDLRLYLDTHPHDRQALALFEEYRVTRQRAIAEYTECYGPVTSYEVLPGKDGWTWNCGPMPWEAEV